MRKKKVHAIAIKSLALLLVPGTAYQAVALAATTPSNTTPYAKVAAMDQYPGAGLTAGSASRFLLK